jgi:hypothetical protein
VCVGGGGPDWSAGAPPGPAICRVSKLHNSFCTHTMLQVDGCSAKLSNCKAYCVRYRVCQQHLGAAAVLIDGVQSRFCQQCGRFEELSEFDGAKR